MNKKVNLDFILNKYKLSYKMSCISTSVQLGDYFCIRVWL